MANEKMKQLDSPGENVAHPLYQLIGAPLLALVQAESQAAQTTAEFIRNIGFTDAENPEDFGNLRMASLRNRIVGSDGQPKDVSIKVPILSMVPIPALQIKDAELEFYVRILDFARTKSNAMVTKQAKIESGETPAQDQEGNNDSFLEPERMEFRAAMGRDPADATQQQRMDAQIRVKINVAQADIPVGMSKLFHIMDQSIETTDETVEEPPVEPPKDE